MFLPTPNDSNFVPPPAGSHAAICYRFIDIGTQVVTWQGTRKTQRKVIIGWELPNEKMEDGRPFSITRRYTWSMSEKSNLRHDLEAWRGKRFTDADFNGANRFDIKNIIGVPCMLSIVHTEKDGSTYANISSVSALPKGMPQPEPVNQLVYFSLEADRFNRTVLESLSDKLREIITATPEYQQLMMMNGNPEPEAREYEHQFNNDDIPF